MELFPLTYSITESSDGLLSELSIVDLIFSFIWIFIVLGILQSYRSGKKEKEYRYFIPFFLFKIVTLFGFVLIYLFYYKGGDTTAYWLASNALIHLAINDFQAFINELPNFTEYITHNNLYVKNGIHYPGWIIREKESYFVAKVTFFINLISGKQFLLTSLYFTLFVFLSQWRFFLLLKRTFLKNKDSKFHLLLLFIPSVSFWCTGITKDGLILIGVLNLTYYFIKWFILKEHKIKHLFGMIVFGFLIYMVRDAILVVFIGSFVFVWNFTLVNSISQKSLRFIARIFLTIFGLIVFIVAFYVFNLNEVFNSFMDEALVIKNDFTHNETYTGKAYDLGYDNSLFGLFKVSPLAIFTGIFRPLIFESFNLTLFLNGLEGTLLFYLFIKRVVFRMGSFFSNLFDNKIVLLCFIVAIFYAFIIGFTSIVFGVLVRLRAPLLLFFVIVIYWEDFLKRENGDKLQQPEDKSLQSAETQV